jgi:hypothetical protein
MSGIGGGLSEKVDLPEEVGSPLPLDGGSYWTGEPPDGERRRVLSGPAVQYGAQLENPLLIHSHPTTSEVFKGTVARDCRPLVFFMNRPHMSL